MAFVEQLEEYSWCAVCVVCCHMALVLCMCVSRLYQFNSIQFVLNFNYPTKGNFVVVMVGS